jgi:hypothetical protein
MSIVSESETCDHGYMADGVTPYPYSFALDNEETMTPGEILGIALSYNLHPLIRVLAARSPYLPIAMCERILIADFSGEAKSAVLYRIDCPQEWRDKYPDTYKQARDKCNRVNRPVFFMPRER